MLFVPGPLHKVIATCFIINGMSACLLSLNVAKALVLFVFVGPVLEQRSLIAVLKVVRLITDSLGELFCSGCYSLSRAGSTNLFGLTETALFIYYAGFLYKILMYSKTNARFYAVQVVFLLILFGERATSPLSSGSS